MHLDEFAEGNTVIHRLDPRVKLLAGAPLVFVVALMEGIGGPLAALALAVLLSAVARLSPRMLLQRLLAVNVFVVLLWVFVPFGYPGEAALSIGPLTATHEGLRYVLGITLKTNAMVLVTIALLGTSHVFELAHALVHMRFPQKLVHLFFFFYRYISVLHDEYTRLRNAMRMRSFRPRTDMHTYRTYAYLVGMLLVRSFERSQRVYGAMLCRGFHGHFPLMSHFHLHRADIVFAVLMAAATVYLGAAL